MEQFDYKKYLKNNPLRTQLNENLRPGYHPDGTPKSNDEMGEDEREEFYLDLDSVDEIENLKPGYHPDGTPKSDDEMGEDEREEFYLDLDSVDEKKSPSKMKMSELKTKIKEDILSILREQDEDEELEDVDVDNEEQSMDVDEPVGGLTSEEQEVQNSLKIAYDNAVSMGDQKLADQIGNSITFFTRTHIVER